MNFDEESDLISELKRVNSNDEHLRGKKLLYYHINRIDQDKVKLKEMREKKKKN